MRAEQFPRLIGETPPADLARWRVQVAARLLRTADHTVGYRSEAACNRAFERELGLPPARYRATSGRQARLEGA